MKRVAAIHQPNFFPWLGYFNKIARADVFVFLDDAQHTATGGNWSNRVRLLVSGEPRWVTAPVARPPHGTQRVNEVAWAVQPWRDKVGRGIALNYGRAPYFAEAWALLQPLVSNPEPMMAAYNMHAVRAIAEALELRTPLLVASSFGLQSTGTERLIELTRGLNCDTYLAGGGAAGYQEDAQFSAAGLALEYQSFHHPAYPQRSPAAFEPGMSIIDALMHCGIARTRELVSP